MNKQEGWAEEAVNRSTVCWKDLITSRVEISLERISRDPEYQELKQSQKKSEKQVDKLLEKLEEGGRSAIQQHYDRQTLVENYELEEAYMQGLRDGIRFLLWLDIFQVKEWG